MIYWRDSCIGYVLFYFWNAFSCMYSGLTNDKEEYILNSYKQYIISVYVNDKTQNLFHTKIITYVYKKRVYEIKLNT